MNCIAVSILLLMSSVSLQTRNTTIDIPKTWTRDFIITLSYSGSMDGSATHITFSYDSCKYVGNSGMEAKKENMFALTESDRMEILKQMRTLRVDKIRSEMSHAPINDGWMYTLCFNGQCEQSGPSVKMTDQDKEEFSKAYDYLENFAIKRHR